MKETELDLFNAIVLVTLAILRAYTMYLERKKRVVKRQKKELKKLNN